MQHKEGIVNISFGGRGGCSMKRGLSTFHLGGGGNAALRGTWMARERGVSDRSVNAP